MKAILVRGGRVLDLDGDLDDPPVRDVLIEGNTIRSVAARLDTSMLNDLSSI